jgi:tetratricopeptide (TPR) repeat protein
MNRQNIFVLALIVIFFLYYIDIKPGFDSCEYKIFMDYAEEHSILELGKRYHYGSEYIKQDHQKAEQLYKLALKNHDNAAFIYIGMLYVDIGNIILARNAFKMGVEKGYFQCFTKLGDLYFHQKSLVDLDIAEQYYKAGVKYSHSLYDKSESNEKLNILLSERGDSYYLQDKKGVDVDSEVDEDEDGDEDDDGSDDDGIVDELQLQTKTKHILSEHEVECILSKKTIVPGFMETLNNIHSKEYKPISTEHMILNNPQNVHDYIISNTVLCSVESLKKNTTTTISERDVFVQIRECIFDREQCESDIFFTPDSTKRIEKTLEYIEERTKPYKKTDMTLSSILHLVWNRIHSPCNQSKKNQLVRQLLSHLSECVEDGYLVCMSGVFTRIIDCLSGCDAEDLVTIIPRYALNHELMNKSALISREWRRELPEHVQKIFSKNDTDIEDDKVIDAYTERLKHKLVMDLRDEYVLTGIIEEDVLFLEIQKWIGYI